MLQLPDKWAANYPQQPSLLVWRYGRVELVARSGVMRFLGGIRRVFGVLCRRKNLFFK